jgi:hypothetical protein
LLRRLACWSKFSAFDSLNRQYPDPRDRLPALWCTSWWG